MKIESITLTASEQEEIYQKLIKDFDLECACYKGNSISFDIVFDYLELYCEAMLDICDEWAERDENNQTHLISRQVLKFELFLSYNGDELKTNLDLEDKIKNYYERH